MATRAARWATAAGAVLALAGAARAGELVVCPQCPRASVRAAIAAAAPGDTVRVLAGTYREGQIVVDKPLVLAGEGGAVLDGAGQGEVLTIRADDVTVRDLEVVRSGSSYVTDLAGIRAEGVRNCTIRGNRVRDTFFGIYLAQVTACTVEDNAVTGHAVSETSSGNGIHLWNVADSRVRGNRVTGHRDGVYLEFVRGTDIEENRSERNLRYGLHFMFSEGNTYARNVFRENSAGVAVMYSKHVTMRANRFEDNWGPVAYGLLLKDISDSTIEANVFHRNTTGLFAEGANRLAVTANRFERNGWAIRLMADSLGVVFARNAFLGNSFEVATNGTRSFSALQENYWSDYRGYDLGRDGTGDVPHRPVRLFALLVEQYPQALILLRSPFVELLDVAERVIPILTPQALADPRPLVRVPS
jgi:nitrous oxidase accessory protein